MDRIGVEGHSAGLCHRHNRDLVRPYGLSAVVAGLTLAIQRPLAGTDEASYFRDRLPVHVRLDLSPAKALSLRSRALRFPVVQGVRLLVRSRPSLCTPVPVTIHG